MMHFANLSMQSSRQNGPHAVLPKTAPANLAAEQMREAVRNTKKTESECAHDIMNDSTTPFNERVLTVQRMAGLDPPIKQNQ